jgi:Lsr2
LGVSLMRITIDTREDTYEDALGVLRRAYGRHRLLRKPEESPAVPEAVDLGSAAALAEESDNRPASGAVRRDAGSRKRPAKGSRKSETKRSPAITAVAESPAAKATVKRASGKKTVRRASTPGRPGAPRKRTASGGAVNVAPRGQSEAVRAWAQEQGMQVHTRGRMPAKVISAYLEAHNE